MGETQKIPTTQHLFLLSAFVKLIWTQIHKFWILTGALDKTFFAFYETEEIEKKPSTPVFFIKIFIICLFFFFCAIGETKGYVKNAKQKSFCLWYAFVKLIWRQNHHFLILLCTIEKTKKKHIFFYYRHVVKFFTKFSENATKMVFLQKNMISATKQPTIVKETSFFRVISVCKLPWIFCFFSTSSR